MALLDIWRSNPDQFTEYAIRQIVAIAGDGKLNDNSACCQELRTFLQEVDSNAFVRFADECLREPFDNSGFVLQDIVNEIGRRLEFEVENGLYRGKSNAVGFDGVWKRASVVDLVIEVKTTDLYNVKLDSVAAYRNKLVEREVIQADSAVLFVVGRQDTGSLEAQIRGSRHAWTMRVVGVDSLLRLLEIKEKSTSTLIVTRIQSLLRPVEYTRIDGIVDVMFDTTAEVEKSASDEVRDVEASSEGAVKASWESDTTLIESKRARAVKALGKKLGVGLVKKRRASFASPDGSVRAVAVVSKRYGNKSEPYWYAYHPSQDEFLGDARDAYFVLGCADTDLAYAVPLHVMREHRSKMNRTILDNREYWHVKGRPIDGKYHLVLKGGELISLDEYSIDA